MRAFLQRQQPVIVTAVVVGALVAFGPGVAQAAYDAVNADKVDGKHAVGAGSTVAGRAGKLVATDAEGRLPNNIIAKAPDSAKLGGVGPLGWLRDLTGAVDGDNIADGSVAPADLVYGATWPTVYGVVKFDGVLADSPAAGIESADILRAHYLEGDILPEGAEVGDVRPGIYCIGGLDVTPVTVNASSSLNFGSPAVVTATLGAAGECGYEHPATQVSIFIYSYQGSQSGYDSAFNLQVWGIPTS